MKWFKKYPLFWLVILSVIIMSLTALADKNSVYREESYDWKKEPALTVVLRGLQSGKVPTAVEIVQGKVMKTMSPVEDAEVQETISGDSAGATGEPQKEDTLVQSTVSGNQTEDMPTYEFQTVDESYFDDAVFIGDSRTVGLFDYSGLSNTTFYAKTSLTVYDYFDNRFITQEGTLEKLTIDEALQQRQFGKVYIMLGINELGRGTPQSFGAEYLKVLTRIRQLQPNAILFVEGIMHVSAEKSATDPIFNNPNIDMRNSLLAIVDNHHDVFYIDMNEAVSDPAGDLNAEYTFDGIHLKASYYSLWKEFLMQHGIVRESDKQ